MSEGFPVYEKACTNLTEPKNRKKVGEMMKKQRMIISLLLVSSLFGLTACSEQTAKEKALEKKVNDLQKQVDKQKKYDQAKKTVVQKPITVDVIDPETKKAIKTFTPQAMGFGDGTDKYKKELDSWAKELARGTNSSPGYDSRMIPDKIGANGQIIKGKPRRILEESELVDKIMEASVKGGKVELPLYVTNSGYKPEDVANLSEAVVASFSTHFNSSVKGRTTNIELSVAAINNVILGNQDYFSFNTTVGPSDQAHGYQPAKEAVGGKLVDGIGGGICQTSSTLYNAVDKIKVRYVEKHHHSVEVGYVPTGRDATVSYGGPDFRFQNVTGVPLLIKAYVDKAKGNVTVELRTSKANLSLIK